MARNAAAATGALVARLRSAGCVFAEQEAELLLAEASGADELESLVRRRVAGEPLEYVLGWAEFAGIRIAVAPGVFVPRPRSEFLVDAATTLLGSEATVLDLCCGTGAIGAALLTAKPRLTLVAADVDPAAVRCARRNLPTGTEVVQGDLFQPVPERYRGRFDMIVANAPYVPTGEISLLPAEARLHEARTSLDGGEDGLRLHRRIAMDAPGWLSRGGRLLIETSERQAPLAAEFLSACGLLPSIRHSDEWDATAVIATREA